MGSTMTIKDMEFSYAGHFKPVFKEVNLQLNSDWKLGLIGRNGRGKTTLLKLIHGSLKADKGTITKPTKTEIFPYAYADQYTLTLDVIKDNIGPYKRLEEKMEQLEKSTGMMDQIAYAETISAYGEIEGFELEAHIQREFNLIHLSPQLLDRPFHTLSGGEKTKALIVALFLRKNHFLLLDEPTNHLDIEGKASLATYLAAKKGFVIISHDRAFLDTCVDHILSINKCQIALEKGTFSSWNNNRLQREAFELKRKEHLEAEIKQMERAARQSRRFSMDREKGKSGAFDSGFEGARAARLMKRAKNIERRKDEQLMEKKELLKDYEHIPRLILKQEEADYKQLICVQDLSFAYGDHDVLRKLSFNVEKRDRIWIRGANGTGKSTLLNILRGRLKGYQGILKVQHDLMISESFQEALWKQGTLRDILIEAKIDETTFRRVLAYFHMHEEFFERPLETFSQGELKKIDLARAMAVPNQLMILDEPLNYMDLFFRQQLEKAIQHFMPTLIFVEHDVVFGEAIANKEITLKII